MQPGKPHYEYRAWAESFPKLPQPDREPWFEETYLVALGLASRSIKIRGDALEIKELLEDREGIQLWNPSARLVFPIPALTLERELMVLLQIGQPLAHERYGPREIMEDIVEARSNVVAVPVRKRRHLFECAGCRAETAEVEVGGRRIMTAAAEHEDVDALLKAVRELGIGHLPNIAYPMALMQLRPLGEGGTSSRAGHAIASPDAPDRGAPIPGARPWPR
jgi:hypothetical protein